MKKKIAIGLLCVCACAMPLSACGDDEPTYEENLNSGLDKFYSGEEMNENEYNAVNDFFEWEMNGGEDQEKTYEDWSN